MAAKAAPKKNMSAMKRARQAEARNLRNRMERSKIKSALKDAENAIQGENKEAAGQVLRQAIKTVSMAKTKGILHRNNASRKIAQLSRKFSVSQKSEAV